MAVEKYMADETWDYYINLGDHLDYFCISRFNEDSPGIVEGKSILEECKTGERILDRHAKIIRKNNPKAELYLLEGNHEKRAYDYINRFPFFRGMIEPEVVLKLDEKKIKYIRSWSHGDVLTIGKANFIHGIYTNIHHAKKHVEAFEENIFYGHVHDCNAYNKTAKGTGKVKVGQSLGCLCEYPKEVDYTHGRPSNWNQAVTTFYFREDGLFNYYISRIFEHKFIAPNGKMYDSK